MTELDLVGPFPLPRDTEMPSVIVDAYKASNPMNLASSTIIIGARSLLVLPRCAALIFHCSSVLGTADSSRFHFRIPMAYLRA